MKTLIVYSSKHGFAEECVEYIKDKLKSEVSVVNVNENQTINLNDYDWIIMGGSAYMAKMNKNLKRFAVQNTNTLITKNLALFVCCMTPNESEKYIQECFPKKIYKSTKFRANFGGKLNKKKLNFFERNITKMVAKQEDKEEKTFYQNMDTLVELVNSHI